MERADKLYCESEHQWQAMGQFRENLQALLALMRDVMPAGVQEAVASCEADLHEQEDRWDATRY